MRRYPPKEAHGAFPLLQEIIRTISPFTRLFDLFSKIPRQNEYILTKKQPILAKANTMILLNRDKGHNLQQQHLLTYWPIIHLQRILIHNVPKHRQ